MARSRRYKQTRSTRTASARNCLALGAAAPHPAAYGLSPPLFQPLTDCVAHHPTEDTM
jgi:hypothetical protein